MKDIINRFLLNKEAVITAVGPREIAETARELHGTYPTCTAALGRLLTAAVIMSCSLKREEELVTLSLDGGGPAGKVLATATGAHTVKGYIENPEVDIPAKENGKLDVSGAVGNKGYFTVIKDLGVKEPYIGRTPLVSGEVAEDMALYYLKSEQQPNIVYLCVWVDIDTHVIAAGGLTVAPFPGASEETLSFIESRVPLLMNYGVMLMSLSPEEAARRIFEGGSLEKTYEAEPKYLCDCGAERFERGIISLGKKEIESIIREDGQAEVVCRFCGKRYEFSKDILQRLLEEAK